LPNPSDNATTTACGLANIAEIFPPNFSKWQKKNSWEKDGFFGVQVTSASAAVVSWRSSAPGQAHSRVIASPPDSRVLPATA
jgi:hypothetical protein